MDEAHEIYCSLFAYLEDKHRSLYKILKEGRCWIGGRLDNDLSKVLFGKNEVSCSFLIPSDKRLNELKKMLGDDKQKEVYEELALCVVYDSSFSGKKDSNPELGGPERTEKPKLGKGYEFKLLKDTVGKKDRRVTCYLVTVDKEIKGGATALGRGDGQMCDSAIAALTQIYDHCYAGWLVGGFGCNPVATLAVKMKMCLEKTHKNELEKVLKIVRDPRVFPMVVLGPNSLFIRDDEDVKKLSMDIRDHSDKWIKDNSTFIYGGNSEELDVKALASLEQDLEKYLSDLGWADDLGYAKTLFELNYRGRVRFDHAQKCRCPAVILKTKEMMIYDLEHKSTYFLNMIKLIPVYKRNGLKLPPKFFKGDESIRNMIEEYDQKIDNLDSLDRSMLEYLGTE